MSQILLLTVDTLREDVVNNDIFPNSFSYFQDDFQRGKCLSHGVATPFAFPAILAGQDASGDGMLKATTQTLAEIADSGAGFPNNPHLFRERGYHRGFDIYETGMGNEPPLWKRIGGKLPGAKRAAEVLPFGGSTGDRSPPYALGETVSIWVKDHIKSHNFVWAHYMDPHFPFRNACAPYISDINVSQEKIDRVNEAYCDRVADDGELELVFKLYKSNIRYLDKTLAELFEWMKQEQIYSQTRIVLTADHGEAFGEEGVQHHDWAARPINELIKVPLLIKPAENERDWSVGAIINHKTLFQDLSARLRDTTKGDPLDKDHYTISKSNKYLRCTQGSAIAYRSREGQIERAAGDNKFCRNQLMSADFPEIANLSGATPGAETTVIDRLDALGYK